MSIVDALNTVFFVTKKIAFVVERVGSDAEEIILKTKIIGSVPKQIGFASVAIFSLMQMIILRAFQIIRIQ